MIDNVHSTMCASALMVARTMVTDAQAGSHNQIRFAYHVQFDRRIRYRIGPWRSVNFAGRNAKIQMKIDLIQLFVWHSQINA